MTRPDPKEREISFIPDRLIAEPVVFRGLTDTEVVWLIAVGIVIWIPFWMIVLAFFGIMMFGVAIGFGCAILTLLVLSGKLTAMKRRMPDGLHVIYIKKRAQQKFSFINFGYIDYSGVWDIRRTVKVTRRKPIEGEAWDE